MPTPFGAASWISSLVTGGARTNPPAPHFRKPFPISKPLRSATLTITALGLYEAEINGKRVGDQVFAPGWTDYAKRVLYQIHDVTALLGKGENVVGVVLGDGWYSGAVGWRQERQHYGDRPQFVARLALVFADGTRSEVVTDTTWTTAVGPILEQDFLMGESYDARLELGAWSRPGYREDGEIWRPARPAPKAAPRIEFTVSEAPPVRRVEELKARAPRHFPGNGDFGRLYDFGQNFTGRVRVAVRAPRGTTLVMRFAEILNPDGTIYTENLRGARATDHYTCKGGAEEVWEPRFTFHGFRYLEVRGLEQDAPLRVTGVVLHSDTRPTGRFACSHPLLNLLQKNIVWGQRGNFLEVPTDCPQRDERLGWTGDAQVFIRTAAFNMDVQGFFRKWVRDIRDAQGPEGGVPATVPNLMMKHLEDGGPAWSDATVICPWTVYLCYGDKQILEDHYDSMARYLRYLGKKKSIGRIRCHPGADAWGGFGDWLALDGGGKTEGITPKDLIGTAFYAHDALLLARISDILGRKAEAKTYRALREKIIAAFRARFVTPDGLLTAGTQTAYVLALHFGLLAEKHIPLVAKALADDVAQRGFHLATGFVGTPYVLEVLEEHGHLDAAYRLLEQETFPSWLFPVKNGATTIWERWDGWTPEKGPQDKGMNSYNHYAYGAVGAWMYRTVAGLELDPEEPAYRHIVFRPRPGGTLTWAEAELDSPQGRVRIRWDKTRAGLKLDLTVPSGARATLLPPEGYGAARAFRPGRHRLTLKSPAPARKPAR